MDLAPPEFAISRKGYACEQVDAFVETSERELASTRRRIDELERELEQLTEDNERLEAISARTADLTTQLRAALDRATHAEEQLEAARENEEAVRLMLNEASKTRQAMLSEAETQIEDTMHEAEIEASHVVEQAFTRARAIVDDARDKADALREAQAAEIEGLEYMRTVYDELAETLHMVARAAIDELSRARAPLDQLLRDHQPAAEVEEDAALSGPDAGGDHEGTTQDAVSEMARHAGDHVPPAAEGVAQGSSHVVHVLRPTD